MDKKLKVLFIQHATEVSGSMMSLYYTTMGLSKFKERLDYRVVCLNEKIKNWYDHKEIPTEYYPHVLTFGHCSGHTYNFFNLVDLIKFFVKLLSLPKNVFKQYQFFKNNDADIIHLNSSVLLASAMAATLAKKKVIWHIREVLADGVFGFRKCLWRKFYHYFSYRIVCISEMEAMKIDHDFQRNNQIEIVYNFIPFDNFKITESKASTLEKFSLATEKNYILSLGGANPIKATSNLLRALIHLPVNYEVLVVGDDRFYQEFKSSGKKRILSALKVLLGSTGQLEFFKLLRYENLLKGRVHYLGSHENIPDIINCSSVLYFGYTIPHFPRPIFESWFLNKPVVSFNNPLFEVHVAHGENALLCHSRHAEKLAQNIKSLVEDQELAQKLVTSGNNTVLNKFNLSKNITKLVKIYTED